MRRKTRGWKGGGSRRLVRNTWTFRRMWGGSYRRRQGRSRANVKGIDHLVPKEFHPRCVVQSKSGKVHKFLHIDESIGRNKITIKGHSLDTACQAVPDAIGTQVPGTRKQ